MARVDRGHASEEVETPAEALQRLLNERFNGSKRALARALAGDGATTDDVESRRAQVRNWLGGQGIQEKNAVLLAAVFDVPLETFFIRPERRTARDRRIDELEAQVKTLRDQVAELLQARERE